MNKGRLKTFTSQKLMFSDGLFACPVEVLPALLQVLCCKKTGWDG
ncbi:hypothetical protein NEIELOOT_02887 [Neisseria elongata subsp. glycolytica ATCC 29315]|uniref:Uncharacterized protein n=1 Tax=Neisseria elongata subsp. glycolytica ATCC 29315 TaxID=546263 RepID=D4DUX4_NEIEG|nr:hypothetical protein NEIELOOT_02887 [Neisseria elongata subsp. glycolytica ATCC 29315]